MASEIASVSAACRIGGANAGNGDGSDRVTADNGRQGLALARTLAPHLVVEVSPNFREEQVQALRMADQVLVVLRPDFTSLRNGRRALEHLELAGVERDRISLVANRSGQPQGLTPAQAEEALGRKVAHQIPDDAKAMNLATNIGEPAVLSSPNSRASRSFRELAASVSVAAKSK